MRRMWAVAAAVMVCMAFCSPVPADNYAVVGAYFDTALDAARFVVALDARGHSVLGMGLVQTYCLD